MKCSQSKGKCRFSSSSAATSGCSSSPAMNARRAVLRRIQRQELQKLRQLLPSSICRSSSSASSTSVSKNQDSAVILDTIRYIDALHATILARVRSGSLPHAVLDQLLLTNPQDVASSVGGRRQTPVVRRRGADTTQTTAERKLSTKTF